MIVIFFLFVFLFVFIVVNCIIFSYWENNSTNKKVYKQKNYNY